MNLHFVHSGLLYGFIACAIPIIIHLLFKRRYQKKPWAAMQFLLAAYKHTKTSLLLENLLLLLLRILIIFFMVLLFMRPVARVSPILGTVRSAESYILVMDNSYSMGVRSANISPWDNAKKQARHILEKAEENDRVSLILMNDFSRPIFFFEILKTDKSRYEILRKIDELPLSEMGTDIQSAMEELKHHTEQKEYSNKHVFFLSDFQKKTWENVEKKSYFWQMIKSIREDVLSFQLVDVGITDAQNLAITSLKADGIVTVGEKSKFTATIRNYGTKTYPEVAVHLYVDGQKQKTEYISLGQQQEANVVFTPTLLLKGNHTITVELDPDGLLTDNKRHVSFSVIQEVKVLVVDGEPKEMAFESETDYWMAALGGNPQSFIKATKINIGELSPQVHFKNYDIVVLANLQSFESENRFVELETFVEKGGGVFLWLGGKVPQEYYNEELYKPGREILPGLISGAPIGNIEEKEKTIFSLDEIATHRVWKYFHENKRLLEDLRQCFIYKFFPIKIDPNDTGVSVLARYNSPTGHPAFLERRFGKGKVILSTTTIDREWNNFHTDQYGHVFVIMAHEFIQYLVSRPPEENNLLVRFPIRKQFDFFIQSARLVPPQGEAVTPDKKALGKGSSYQIDYADTQKSGIYTLELSIPSQVIEEREDIATKEYFAVNVDGEEGNIEAISKEDLLKNFKDIDIQYEKDMETKASSVAGKQDVEYWRQILVFLLLLTLGETFLAMWFGKYNR